MNKSRLWRLQLLRMVPDGLPHTGCVDEKLLLSPEILKQLNDSLCFSRRQSERENERDWKREWETDHLDIKWHSNPSGWWLAELRYWPILPRYWSNDRCGHSERNPTNWNVLQLKGTNANDCNTITLSESFDKQIVIDKRTMWEWAVKQ